VRLMMFWRWRIFKMASGSEQGEVVSGGEVGVVVSSMLSDALAAYLLSLFPLFGDSFTVFYGLGTIPPFFPTFVFLSRREGGLLVVSHCNVDFSEDEGLTSREQ
jgi:hypothetical protein